MSLNLSHKKVFILTLVTVLVGIAFELITLVNFRVTETSSVVYFLLKSLTPNLHLTFFDMRLFLYDGSDGGFPMYLIDMAVYIAALVGVIVYQRSRYCETRLLRFFFSIILLVKTILLLSYIFYFLSGSNSMNFNIYILLANVVSVAFWFYISLKVLHSLSKDRVLEYATEGETNVDAKLELKEASKLVRLVHKIVDALICLAICSSSFYYYWGFLFERLGLVDSSRLLLYVAAIFSQFIFFLFFEYFFGATPAKYLTESRVVNSDGHAASFGHVLGRTCARLIPFELLSFLGSGYGWHDSLSNTTVVREKSIGVSGRKYLLLIPMYILLAAGCYYGSEFYSDYRSYCSAKKEYEQTMNGITEKLAKLSTSSVIVLCDVDDPVSTTNLVLKVEKVSGENIVASVLAYDAFATYPVIEKQYSAASGMLDKVTISLSDLRKGLTPNYSDYKNENFSWLTIPNDKHKYRIEDVVDIFGPCIVSSYSGCRYGDILSLKFENKGWSADVVELKLLAGDLKWNDPLPIHIDAASSDRYSYPTFSLSASNYKEGASYKFTFALVDSLGHKQKYLVEGVDFDKTVKRIQ